MARLARRCRRKARSPAPPTCRRLARLVAPGLSAIICGFGLLQIVTGLMPASFVDLLVELAPLALPVQLVQLQLCPAQLDLPARLVLSARLVQLPLWLARLVELARPARLARLAPLVE